MQIILIQAEIEVAIRNYVNSKVKIAAGQDIRIDLSASRGPEGFRANIDIVDAEVPVEAYSPRAATTAAPKTAAVETDAPKKKAAPAQLEAEVEEFAAPSTEKVAADEPSAQEQEVAQEQEQEAPSVEESAEASTTEPAPTVRKPLFGKSLASLNA
mgnify:CR=1 FL=1